MPPLRYQSPDRLPGAANFADESLRGSLNAVKLVKSQKWVWQELREVCTGLEKNYARHREPGHWELATVAFVTSGQVNVRPWWQETTDDLWIECGFNARPSYKTVYRRLKELEDVREEFLKAAAAIIQRCRKHDPRVMAHVHFDWTEDSTAASLLHDCQKGEKCGRDAAGQAQDRRATRAPVGEARDHRHEAAALDEDTGQALEEAASPEKVGFVWRDGRKFKRVRIRGCWYRTRDLDGGIRAYTGPAGLRRFWHGFYGGKAICHFTGGVIPSVDSASIQEWNIFPKLFDRAAQMSGATPETAIADRGVSREKCFQHLIEHGTAPVIPWRANGTGKRRDYETHDRHGLMRCKHCGGAMRQVRFSAGGRGPRLWFSCILKPTRECAGDQTISCNKDWKLLIPLARTEPLYHELKLSHQTYEAVHRYWRDRYKVGGDSVANTPKIVGIDWHRLRANVACFVDWLRIAAKNSWLGAKPKKNKPQGVRTFAKHGEQDAKSLIKRRTRLGLDMPYGRVAKLLGLGDEEPPSDRPPPTRLSRA